MTLLTYSSFSWLCVIYGVFRRTFSIACLSVRNRRVAVVFCSRFVTIVSLCVWRNACFLFIFCGECSSLQCMAGVRRQDN